MLFILTNYFTVVFFIAEGESYSIKVSSRLVANLALLSAFSFPANRQCLSPDTQTYHYMSKIKKEGSPLGSFNFWRALGSWNYLMNLKGWVRNVESWWRCKYYGLKWESKNYLKRREGDVMRKRSSTVAENLN